jgi:hypothetical protein
MLEWLRRRRRRRLVAEPFPEAWRAIIHRNVPHYADLDEGERARVRDFVQIFLAEKAWEGCGGLVLNDEIRVTVAAQAGLLVLGLPHEYYRNVRTILVYPSTVVTPDRPPGVFEQPRIHSASGIPILGEAQTRGPVILVWDAVMRAARHPHDGHNVVYHEFAHKLDMLDGAPDGTPVLGSRAAIERWAEVCSRAFNDLRARVEQGSPTFLDAYAATNEAEFFAVATEYFFDRPGQMQTVEPDLYGVLRDFYAQDPAERAARAMR